MYQSQHIKVNGLTLHTLCWNDEKKELPLIVLFHGWLDHAASWIECMNRIADEGYRIMVPEQRGHGHTSRVTERNGSRGFAVSWSPVEGPCTEPEGGRQLTGR